MKKPNFFLVGCGRSGTTSLFEALKQHPAFFGPVVKGPDFFADVPNKAYPEFFRNEKKYLSLFKKVKNEKIIGDASHYFHLKNAPTKIRKFNKNSKVLISLRNPFDLISNYFLLENFPQVDSLKKDSSLRKNADVNNLLESLKYSENLKRWIDNFGKENVYVMILERFEGKNKPKEFSKICKFLKIDSSFIPDFKIHNPSRETKNKWFSKLIEISPLFIKDFVRIILGKNMTEKFREAVTKFTTKRKTKKLLKHSIKEEFKDELKSEILGTQKILGQKIPEWKVP